MKFYIFGREFYFFASEAQFNKFIDFVSGYAINPAVISSVIVVIFYGVLLIYFKKRKMPYHYRSFKKLQFVIVLYFIIAFSFLNRTEHTRYVMILIPDVTAGGDYYHESMILLFTLNVIMYAPYGYYLAVFYGRELSVRKVYLTVVPTSLAVEVGQYIFAAGYSTSAEVIASFCGASIGILLYTFKYKLLKPKTMREAIKLNQEKLYE